MDNPELEYKCYEPGTCGASDTNPTGGLVTVAGGFDMPLKATYQRWLAMGGRPIYFSHRLIGVHDSGSAEQPNRLVFENGATANVTKAFLNVPPQSLLRFDQDSVLFTEASEAGQSLQNCS